LLRHGSVGDNRTEREGKTDCDEVHAEPSHWKLSQTDSISTP
jgi:hypothetical protein